LDCEIAEELLILPDRRTRVNKPTANKPVEIELQAVFERRSLFSGAQELTKPHQGKILSEREHRHHEVLKDHFHARSASEAVP
jgi:hypothetical protein